MTIIPKMNSHLRSRFILMLVLATLAVGCNKNLGEKEASSTTTEPSGSKIEPTAGAEIASSVVLNQVGSTGYIANSALGVSASKVQFTTESVYKVFMSTAGQIQSQNAGQMKGLQIQRQ